MNTTETADLPGVVDPTSVAYWEDIHGTLGPLREQWPVVRSTAGVVEVLRYEHGEPLLRDPRMRQALQGMLANQGITSGPLYEWWQLIMNNHDVPSHTRLRSLVGRAFTPKQVERIRPRVGAIAHELVDALLEQGKVDVQATFCHQLPLVVLCEMLGLPPEDHAVVERWTTTVALAFSAVIPPSTVNDIERAVVDFNAYTEGLIERRRAAPGDDLLSALVLAEESGDRLTHDELRALIINLLFAGHDTTKSLLSIAIWLLMTHPDQLALLRDDPSLLNAAVEEIARYETPISGIPRVPCEDIVVAGVSIPAGSYLTVSVPSANRDPRRFDDADRFDVTRTDNRHLTFGFGIHHCVGAAVARAEVQEALRVLVDRVDLEPAGEEPRWVPFAAARRFESLPVVARPASAR
ncbi:MAG TPA: cytochrome P450 [Acidimicrobiales bacterium]|nr:cytochrome P450 [Acidimicrobiales bacterium]